MRGLRLGTVGMVLLIAGANLANLFLERAEGRQREPVLHIAIGGGRSQIARGLLLESTQLASYFPGHRASGVDPVEAFRSE